jgi:hypothetical protein
MNRKVALRLLLFCMGIGMIVVAAFAFQLGLDNNPEWGPKRFQIAGLGAFVVFWGFFYWLSPLVSRIFSRLVGKPFFLNRKIEGNSIADRPFIHQIRQSRIVQTFTRHPTNIFLVLLAVLALWSYLWILTAGRLEQWPTGKNYYHLLAQAFQHGQLHLLLEPSPELLALDNPYDYRNRENIPQLWDATLYDGKYYLYWGPVPGLIGALWLTVTNKPLTDAGLVLLFLYITALFGLLLLKKIAYDFRYPAWLSWSAAIVLVFNVPALWLLTRPSVYEASIAGGQAFILAGLYFGYCGLRSHTPNKNFLILSGLALGSAGGTRTSLLISAAVLAFLMACYLYVIYKKHFRKLAAALLSLGIPLALVLAALLWYNYARFNSVFEFGHRYQLTGLALPANYHDVSSVKYTVPNFYTYFLRPPDFSAEFPFIAIPWIKEPMWPSFIRLPENYYYTEPTAGILLIVPLFGMAVFLVARFAWLWLDGELQPQRHPGIQRRRLFRLLFLCLLFYSVIQTTVLLLFISSSLRYLFDITPMLILLSTIFAGSQLKRLATQPGQEKLFFMAWVTVCLVAALFAVLVSLTGYARYFAKQNPALYQQISNWFQFP